MNCQRRRNNNVILWIGILIAICASSGCSVTGKYYVKHDYRLHEWIDLEKDSICIISKWADIRFENSGKWYTRGDTIIVQGNEFLHGGNKLTSLNNGVVYRKYIVIFPRLNK